LINVLKNGTPEEFRNKMRKHLYNYFEKIWLGGKTAVVWGSLVDT
jgi:hypothetical protein